MEVGLTLLPSFPNSHLGNVYFLSLQMSALWLQKFWLSEINCYHHGHSQSLKKNLSNGCYQITSWSTFIDQCQETQSCDWIGKIGPGYQEKLLYKVGREEIRVPGVPLRCFLALPCLILLAYKQMKHI